MPKLELCKRRPIASLFSTFRLRCVGISNTQNVACRVPVTTPGVDNVCFPTAVCFGWLFVPVLGNPKVCLRTLRSLELNQPFFHAHPPAPFFHFPRGNHTWQCTYNNRLGSPLSELSERDLSGAKGI